MAKTPSTMVALGTKAPDFDLPDTEGQKVALSDFKDSSHLLIIFMCNHCPFVKHIREGLTRLANDYASRGLAVVAINSNDVENYPDDSPEKMRLEKKEAAYPFPYLFDATQNVAKSYYAACTPDFFLYDQNRTLIYRGQLDNSRPGNGKPVTGSDLREALEKGLSGQGPVERQIPSMGCNIKWKPGNEPPYFGS